jgi:hypothetical protein
MNDHSEGHLMLISIDNLREIARLCQSGEPLGEELSRWLGNSLEQFLCRRALTIEDALGLRAPRGGVPWWLEEAMRRRDAALRSLAAEAFAELSPSAQAAQLHRLSMRYAASAWRHDQGAAEMPSYYHGKANAWLWRAFKSGAPMPICERQLRKLLAR